MLQPASSSLLCVAAPAARPEPAGSNPAPVAGSERPYGRGERVLVIDDDELIARGTVLLLEKLGYRPEAHSNPRDVVEAIRRQPHQIDLLVTDQSMPGLAGADLAAQARAIRPDLPVLIMTGYGTDILTADLASTGPTEVLRKPARREAIAVAVRRLLARTPAA